MSRKRKRRKSFNQIMEEFDELMPVYILDSDGEIQRATPIEFAKWLTTNERTIARSAFNKNADEIQSVKPVDGYVTVSTVFIGMDMSIDMENEHVPILFETMVFGPKNFDSVKYRYATLSEATAGHEAVCRQVVRQLLKRRRK